MATTRREGWSDLKQALNEIKSFDRSNGDLNKIGRGLSYQHFTVDEAMCQAVRALANIAGCPNIGKELVVAFDNVMKDYGDDY